VREIAALAEGQEEAGRYFIQLDGSGLPSGVYSYRLEVNGRLEQQEMVLRK
jgi:hypothetical protein